MVKEQPRLGWPEGITELGEWHLRPGLWEGKPGCLSGNGWQALRAFKGLMTVMVTTTLNFHGVLTTCLKVFTLMCKLDIYILMYVLLTSVKKVLFLPFYKGEN